MNGSLALAPSFRAEASVEAIASMMQEAQKTAPEEEKKVPDAGNLKKITRETYVSIFIERTEKSGPVAGLVAEDPVAGTVEAGNLVTAVVPLAAWRNWPPSKRGCRSKWGRV